ncbi:uncharacterized protein LOC112506412 isoform X2 [Cynara cardunculus var. scolymus]|uniref:uncharacterized protein LOC112506412 isoform X2 n=1 Tax=Cynara cardunculus var. scolymus TaxID=59895 RepID=UPI000D623ADA|nr:uncharacterized protein LOC112506412 isoform X2 [Cynara cardunculus var. scolymus]
MLGEEARMLLGFFPNSSPSSSQVKAAYKKKAWETHPDRFPLSQRSLAESNFKLISEAYTCLQSGSGVSRQVSASGLTEGRKRHIPRITLSFLEVTYIYIRKEVRHIIVLSCAMYLFIFVLS